MTLEQMVENGIENQNCLIIGACGSGKTNVLNILIAELLNDDFTTVSYHTVQQGADDKAVHRLCSGDKNVIAIDGLDNMLISHNAQHFAHKLRKNKLHGYSYLATAYKLSNLPDEVVRGFDILITTHYDETKGFWMRIEALGEELDSAVEVLSVKHAANNTTIDGRRT